jgi:hypothetical protein
MWISPNNPMIRPTCSHPGCNVTAILAVPFSQSLLYCERHLRNHREACDAGDAPRQRSLTDPPAGSISPPPRGECPGSADPAPWEPAYVHPLLSTWQ